MSRKKTTSALRWLKDALASAAKSRAAGWNLLVSWGEAMSALDDSERFFRRQVKFDDAFKEFEKWEGIRDSFPENSHEWTMAHKEVERALKKLDKYCR